MRSIRLRFLTLLLAAAAFGQGALAQGYFREEVAPKGGKGPAVLVISGQTGPESRKAFARDVAAQGYNVLLVDGNDLLSRTKPMAQYYKDAVTSLLAHPATTSRKVVVIGFSMGGGALLAHAMTQPDTVAGAIAVYPYTAWIQNVDGMVGRFQVPLLVLAAGADTYNNCCLIERAREIEASAKVRGKAFEMVVYDGADHAYDLNGRAYRAEPARDTARRIEEALKRLHADTAK